MLSAGSVGMTGDAVASADGSAGSTGVAKATDGNAGGTGAAGVEGDTDLDGVAIGFAGDATATSSSVPWASWKR